MANIGCSVPGEHNLEESLPDEPGIDFKTRGAIRQRAEGVKKFQLGLFPTFGAFLIDESPDGTVTVS